MQSDSLVKKKFYYHVRPAAASVKAYKARFEVGKIFLVGMEDSPFGKKTKSAATREAPGINAHTIALGYKNMLREMVLENIRLKYYAHLPSRLSCLFISETLEDAYNWIERLPDEGPKEVLQMELLSGCLHRTNESHLMANSPNVNEWEMFARRYWDGAPGSKLVELLFRGELAVTSVMPA
ncbi:DUF2441 domain-containing protein [Burkholderia cepacia]|uniref:DUF2441 domain-containing protein n=1 Tax=Burkholderia cepacia TaxID=292 RepID=UPI001CF42AE0|nr:DUF2441 domain-containing protein [Burkholderia cepacia]MCA7928939.1 DUF2441 domain-containing protein [Burkholderia cepacia]